MRDLRDGFLGQLTCAASMAVPKNGIAFDPGRQGLLLQRTARGRCPQQDRRLAFPMVASTTSKSTAV
jgi:hypothetical protein